MPLSNHKSRDMARIIIIKWVHEIMKYCSIKLIIIIDNYPLHKITTKQKEKKSQSELKE